MEVRLLVLQGSLANQEFRLNRFPAVLGRQTGCELRITSSRISRRHCVLELLDGWVTVRDLHSANGTTVNGDSVVEATRLRWGDHLEIGSIRFEVRYPAPDRSPIENDDMVDLAYDDPSAGQDSARNTSDATDPASVPVVRGPPSESVAAEFELLDD